MTSPSLLLLGAGAMGGALFSAFCAKGAIDPGRSAVVDPSPSEDVLALCARHGVAVNPARDAGYDLCLLAIKPQGFPAVLPTLDWPGMENTLFVSVAAGITVQAARRMIEGAGGRARLVRTMPSLPAKIGRSVTLLAEDGGLRPGDREAAAALMAAAGEIFWCDSEEQLDRLMGVTGCSPAILFRLAEALEAAALAEGCPAADAQRLSEAAVTGAAALLEADGRSAGALAKAVASPGGTTQAALDHLAAKGWSEAVGGAVRAAYDRAQALKGDA